ncbi:MAG: glycosyltransferase family 4 protein [Gammaproteobacteria bacterium]|nr:glycosyltransferase family 4 protein [Gammaproteobacteria bacterium]MYF31121.1 glycosyltransferase family 4 protein [Gammaproteobacteria bacterium]MYK45398.1 glycosyltransferase family 4 protein [Gammaproteobacteria bacterium]
MRIAVDGRPLRHPFSGIGVYAREILARIADGHELFIYLDRRLDKPSQIKGLYRTGPSRRLSGFLTANVAFARWAKRDRVDVFFSPRHHLPLMLGKIPAVVTIHDMVWRVAPDTMQPLNRLLDTTLMPLALARAERVIAVSADTANRIAAYCGRRDVATIHNAPREVSQAVPFTHPRPYFLFVGTKEPRKNLRGTVEGFRRATAAGLNHDLVLVGPTGWGESGLPADMARDPAAKRIVDLGSIPDERLAGVYESCSALVLASFYEGFGIPLIEAMHHGKPVITSGTGAMAEVVGDAGILVDPGDPASLARAFLKLANDGNTCRRLATNARRRGCAFSWDRAARSTIDVLEDATRRGRSNA